MVSVCVCVHVCGWSTNQRTSSCVVRQSLKEDRERDVARERNLVNSNSNTANGETARLQVSVMYTRTHKRTHTLIEYSLNKFFFTT